MKAIFVVPVTVDTRNRQIGLYLTFVNIGRLDYMISVAGQGDGRSMVLSLIEEKYRLIENVRIVNTFIC